MKELSWHLGMTGIVIFLGFIFLGIIVWATENKNDSQYQQSAPEGKLHFRRPRASRVCSALVCLSFLGGIPFSAGVILDPKSFGITSGSKAEDIGITSFFFLLASFGFSILAGPDEVSLDLSARTYRRVCGWPLFPKTTTGSTREISGVYVDNVGTYSSPVFLVGLRWCGKDISIVGRYDSKEQAEKEADKLQQALGVQRVKPPF